MPHGAIPFPFGDCRICNDKATGVHYGVATCEGCKGFFKRSIPKGDKYKCFFGGHCNLTPQNRNRCKACRFRRCLTAGMSVEAVKMGRIPKIDKERALEVARRHEIEKAHQEQMKKRMNASQYMPLGMDEGMLGGVAYGANTGYNYGYGQCAPAYMGYGPQVHGGASGDLNMDSDSMALVPTATDLLMGSDVGADSSSRCSSSQSVQDDLSEDAIKEIIQQVIETTDQVQCKNEQSQWYPHNDPYKHKTKCPVSSVTTMTMSGHYNPGHHVPTGSHMYNPPYEGHYSAMYQQHHHQNENMVPNSMTGSQWTIPGDTMKTHLPGEEVPSYSATPFGMNSCNISSSSISTSSTTATHSGFQSCMTSSDSSKLSTDTVINSRSTNLNMQVALPQLTSSSEDPDVLSIRKELESCLADMDLLGSLYSKDLPTLTSDVKAMTICSSDGVLNLPSPSGADDKLDLKPDLNSIIPFDLTAKDEMALSCIGSNSTTTTSLRGLGDSTLYDDALRNLTQAISDHDAQMKDMFQNMLLEIAGKIPPHPLNMLKKATRAQVQEVWNSMMEAIPEVNEQILGFAKRVPGFNKIEHDDQQVLLEYAYMEIWLIMSSRLFYNNDCYWTIPNGARYSKFWMRHYGPKSLTDALFHVGSKLQSCSLTPSELAVISAIQLTSERKGLKNPSQVRVLNNFFLDLLAYEMPRNHGNRSSRVLIDIFRILPLLPQINDEQNDVILNFNVDHPPEGCLKYFEEEEVDENTIISELDEMSDLLAV